MDLQHSPKNERYCMEGTWRVTKTQQSGRHYCCSYCLMEEAGEGRTSLAYTSIHSAESTQSAVFLPPWGQPHVLCIIYTAMQSGTKTHARPPVSAGSLALVGSSLAILLLSTLCDGGFKPSEPLFQPLARPQPFFLSYRFKETM